MQKFIPPLLALLLVLALIGIAIFLERPVAGPSGNTGTITMEEKAAIDQWIGQEGLNRYGDPSGTIYAGGTPLFNEQTGASLEVYQYILERHPDAPWRNKNE